MTLFALVLFAKRGWKYFYNYFILLLFSHSSFFTAKSGDATDRPGLGEFYFMMSGGQWGCSEAEPGSELAGCSRVGHGKETWKNQGTKMKVTRR